MVASEMASLRKPYIYILVAIVAAVLIIHFSGILNPTPLGLVITASLKNSEIRMGQNTTIVVTIENKAMHLQTFEFHIVYTSKNLTYYNGITEEPLSEPVYNGGNYTIVYPNDDLGPNEKTELLVIVKGLLPKGASSKRFTVFLEVYSLDGASKVLSDRKSVSLTVFR
jgi:hypothetical protein